MKVLDPQSATLSNPEVLAFLQAHPPRAPDKKAGGYALPDLRGYYSVHKEFDDYITRIVPHTRNYPPPEQWMRPLISKLKPYNLTKTEVLMIINLGIGLNSTSNSAAGPVNPGALQQQQQQQWPHEALNGNGTNGDGDDEMAQDGENGVEMGEEGEEGAAGAEQSDEQVLTAVVEELDQRFNDDDVRAILGCVREAVLASPAAAAAAAAAAASDAIANRNDNRGGERRTNQTMDEVDSVEMPEE